MPIPVPPSILETNIQFKEPITFTMKLAIVKMNVPFKNFSLDLFSVILFAPLLGFSWFLLSPPRVIIL